MCTLKMQDRRLKYIQKVNRSLLEEFKPPTWDRNEENIYEDLDTVYEDLETMDTCTGKIGMLQNDEDNK